MRVIAGLARGRRLRTLPGDATRPVTDRVKTSLFSILGARAEGATVMDLYAGSGALGIEALSRGANRCVFCESSRAAAGIVERNLAECGFADRAEISRERSSVFLENRARGMGRFDIIFYDPPFAASAGGCAALEGEGRAAGERLSEGGLLIVRTRKTDAPAPGWAGLRRTDIRTYGDAAVSFFARAQDE